MPSSLPDRVRTLLGTPVDGAGVRAFRLGFGLLAAASAVRFVARGWVEALYLTPAYHFAWIEWLTVPRAEVLYGLFAVQGVAGIGTALARRYHPWLAVWLAAFVYVELLDKALYLNHYVLMTLMGAFLLAAPLRSDGRVAGWVLALLRGQVALVYAWAGLCKVDSDWLFRAQPLTTWLESRSDLWLVGPLLAWDPTAWFMSWGGCVYDLSIPVLLLWPRTRRLGIVLVIGFHATLGLLFPIGVFPWLMALCVTLFFEPDWPRRIVRRPAPTDVPPRRWGAGRTAAWVALMALLALFPARFLLYHPDVNWGERGYRFAWRVLLTEKTGFVEYDIVHSDGRTERFSPRRLLTAQQYGQLVGKPDLIAQLGRDLGRVHPGTSVYADSWVSLNRGPTQRLVSPHADLARPLCQLDDDWIEERSPLAPEAPGSEEGPR